MTRFFRVESAAGPCWARAEAPGRLRLLDGDPVAGTRDRAETFALEAVRLLPPASPSKIVAIGVFDSFSPVGPCLAVGLELGRLSIECRVNGAVRQRSSTRELVFPPEALVAYVSRVMTLVPGDIISTGTPAGIGPLVAGDFVEVEIEGVGVLGNPVLDDEDEPPDEAQGAQA